MLVRTSKPLMSIPRLQVVASCVAYLCVLHIAYVHVISPYFGYTGLYYSPISNGVLLWSLVAALLPAMWLPVNTDRPSVIVYYLLYAFVVVSVCIVPTYVGTLSLGALLKLQVATLVCFALLKVVYMVPLSEVPRLQLSAAAFFTMLALFTCASYATIVHYFGLSFQLPNPTDVYGVRGEYGQLSQLINSTWLEYCTDWQSLVINPFVMGYGLMSRKYYLTALGFVGQLLIYALGGSKTVLFSLAMTGGVLAIQKYKRTGVAFISAMTLFFVLCIVADVFLLHTTAGLTSMFVRRIVFLPGNLTAQYFDFFSNNQFALLGHSILKGFVSYPYSMPPPKLIGATYLGQDATNANANLWADGFANFGYFGMLGATIILGCCMWLVDSCGTNRNSKLAMLMIGVPGFVLANTGLLTCLGNHGLGFALALVYLLPLEFESMTGRARGHADVAKDWEVFDSPNEVRIPLTNVSRRR